MLMVSADSLAEYRLAILTEWADERVSSDEAS